MGTKSHGLLALASALALLLLGACRPATDADGNTGTGQGAWDVVQAYVESDAAWHARGAVIALSDDSSEERARQREELGPHPDVTAAVAAAREIVADPDHGQGAAAAEFLMEHPYQLSETDHDDMAVGAQALGRLVGPDWSVVQDYQKHAEAWANRREEISAAELPDDKRAQQLGELGDRPKAFARSPRPWRSSKPTQTSRRWRRRSSWSSTRRPYLDAINTSIPQRRHWRERP